MTFYSSFIPTPAAFHEFYGTLTSNKGLKFQFLGGKMAYIG